MRSTTRFGAAGVAGAALLFFGVVVVVPWAADVLPFLFGPLPPSKPTSTSTAITSTATPITAMPLRGGGRRS
jgi:hypothetical protein